MLRQYYAGRWFAPSSNPLRVGPIRVGSIYRLPSILYRRTGSNTPVKWIVVAFRNGVHSAACRDEATGKWCDRVISGRSDTAIIRRLADGYEMDISVVHLLNCDEDQGGADYPDLPDVTRFHRRYRSVLHKEAA